MGQKRRFVAGAGAITALGAAALLGGKDNPSQEPAASPGAETGHSEKIHDRQEGVRVKTHGVLSGDSTPDADPADAGDSSHTETPPEKPSIPLNEIFHRLQGEFNTGDQSAWIALEVQEAVADDAPADEAHLGVAMERIKAMKDSLDTQGGLHVSKLIGNRLRVSRGYGDTLAFIKTDLETGVVTFIFDRGFADAKDTPIAFHLSGVDPANAVDIIKAYDALERKFPRIFSDDVSFEDPAFQRDVVSFLNGTKALLVRYGNVEEVSSTN